MRSPILASFSTCLFSLFLAHDAGLINPDWCFVLPSLLDTTSDDNDLHAFAELSLIFWLLIWISEFGQTDWIS
jgi:hypothetical protein